MSYTRNHVSSIVSPAAEQVNACLTASAVLGTSNLNDLISVVKYSISSITELLVVPICNINKFVIKTLLTYLSSNLLNVSK